MDTNINTAASAVQPASRPQSSDNKVSVHKDGRGAASGFAPRTNVNIRNSVNNMAGILSKISSNAAETEAALPKSIQHIIDSVMKGAFSVESSIGDGVGSALSSSRFSIEQLNILNRMVEQLALMSTKGQSAEMSDELGALLSNVKDLMDKAGVPNGAMLNKLAFRIVSDDGVTARVEIPQELQQLLAQISGMMQNSGQVQVNQGQSDTFAFLKQLVDAFFPKHLFKGSEQAQGQQGQSMSNQQGFVQQNNQGQPMPQGQQGNFVQQNNQGQPMAQGQQGQVFNGNNQPQQTQQGQPMPNQQGNFVQQNNQGQPMPQGQQGQVFNGNNQSQQTQQGQPMPNQQGNFVQQNNQGQPMAQGQQGQVFNGNNQPQQPQQGQPMPNQQGNFVQQNNQGQPMPQGQQGQVFNGNNQPQQTQQGQPMPNQQGNFVQQNNQGQPMTQGQQGQVFNGNNQPQQTQQGQPMPNQQGNFVQQNNQGQPMAQGQQGQVFNGNNQSQQTQQGQPMPNNQQGNFVQQNNQGQPMPQGQQGQVFNGNNQPQQMRQGQPMPNQQGNFVQQNNQGQPMAQGQQGQVFNGNNQAQQTQQGQPMPNQQGNFVQQNNQGQPMAQGQQGQVFNGNNQPQQTQQGQPMPNNQQGNFVQQNNQGQPMQQGQQGQVFNGNNQAQQAQQGQPMPNQQGNFVQQNNQGQPMPQQAQNSSQGQANQNMPQGTASQPTQTSQPGGQPSQAAPGQPNTPNTPNAPTQQNGQMQQSQQNDQLQQGRTNRGGGEDNPLFQNIFRRQGGGNMPGSLKAMLMNAGRAPVRQAVFNQPPMFQNTPQNVGTMREMAQMLLRDNTLSARDSQLLQNFINGNQGNLSQQDAKQLNLLLRMVQNNIPVALQQAGQQQGMEDLPRLWAFMQLCEMASLKDLKAKELRNSSKQLVKFLGNMKGAMQSSGAYQADGQKSISFMIPLYLGENEKSYPTYVNIYDSEPQQQRRGKREKETWLRMCVLTENIGAVEMTCRLYEGNHLNLKVLFSEESIAKDFKEYVPELRASFRESSLSLKELKLGSFANMEIS